MKWALSQLRKIAKPILLDYVEEITKEDFLFDDLIDIYNTRVIGVGNEIGQDEYLFELNIKTTLILESSITLKPVEVSLEINTKEIYATNDLKNQDVNLIIGQTVDLKEAIISNIAINKPYKVIGSGEEDLFEDEFCETKSENIFASLKDKIK